MEKILWKYLYNEYFFGVKHSGKKFQNILYKSKLSPQVVQNNLYLWRSVRIMRPSSKYDCPV